MLKQFFEHKKQHVSLSVSVHHETNDLLISAFCQLTVHKEKGNLSRGFYCYSKLRCRLIGLTRIRSNVQNEGIKIGCHLEIDSRVFGYLRVSRELKMKHILTSFAHYQNQESSLHWAHVIFCGKTKNLLEVKFIGMKKKGLGRCLYILGRCSASCILCKTVSEFLSKKSHPN